MQSQFVPKTTNILIATADGQLTQELSQFLRAAGYHTCEAAQQPTALVAMVSGERRVVIVDVALGVEDDWALVRALVERAAQRRPFLVLLMATPDADQARAALEAGIDDILLVPVCYGELLSRLRAAVRILEHDRRVGRQDHFDMVTGLWSQSAFIGQLRQHWTAAAESKESLACVDNDVDLIRAVRHAEGEASVHVLLAAVAQELNRMRGKSGVLACLGGDRFGVILPGATTEAAAQWAEQVRREIAEQVFRTRDDADRRLTVSIGVAGRESAENADQLLEHTIAALGSAKASGRNRVVPWDEVASQSHAINLQSMVLEGTLARHVMTPCPVFLHADDSSGYAAELLRQTRLEALPVVDAGGHLTGLCKQDLLGNSPRRGADQRVSDVMSSNVRRFRSAEDVAALIDFFNQDPLAWAVVVDDGPPLGLVSCDSLVALSQQAHAASVVCEEPYDETTAYLLVPDLIPELAPEEVCQ